MRISDKIINKISGKDLSQSVAKAKVVITIISLSLAAVFSPLLTICMCKPLCLILSVLSIYSFTSMLFCNFWDFSLYGCGWGNTHDDYYEPFLNSLLYKSGHREPCLYFPIWKHNWFYRVFDSKKQRICFHSTLADYSENGKTYSAYILLSVTESHLETRIIEELSPELIELYKLADFNKETRRYYKSIIPQIKDLYNKFSYIYNQLSNNDTDSRVREDIRRNLENSIDDIILYVQSLKKPLLTIMQYNEDIKNAEYELGSSKDLFAEIKAYNQLSGSTEVDIMSKKYESANESQKAYLKI